MLVVLSPHLDDAVFGCGQLIAAHAGATVVTVLAGRPPRHAPLAPWDADAGFTEGDDVIAIRSDEDRRALHVLGARPRWLEFCDSQYGVTPPAGHVTDALDAAIGAAAATAVVVPLGLFHSDHRLVHDAALAVLARRRRLSWLAYEDAMYRRIPGLVADRLARLRAAGITPAWVGGETGHGRLKRRAVAEYRSQLRALTTPGRPGYDDALAPEGYWRLAA